MAGLKLLPSDPCPGNASFYITLSWLKLGQAKRARERAWQESKERERAKRKERLSDQEISER